MLDIIIPTYNNKKGLLKTLSSIPSNDEIVITIIDDCSEDTNYNIKNANLILNSPNCGPGIARQTALDNWTNQPYITFIDTDDVFLEGGVERILKELHKSSYDIYSWQHIFEKNGKICPETHNRVHGKVYKRDFLDKYSITFCAESSYANEDIGFNRICRLLYKEGLCSVKIIEEPIYMWTYNENSLTRKNNNEFTYKKQNIGLALNGIHIYNTCKNLVSKNILERECGEIMGSLYYGVVQTAQEASEFLDEAWQGAKIFFDTIYKPNNYGAINVALYQTFSKIVKEYREHLQKGEWIKPISLNMNRFLSDLNKYKSPPKWYY